MGYSSDTNGPRSYQGKPLRNYTVHVTTWFTSARRLVRILIFTDAAAAAVGGAAAEVVADAAAAAEAAVAVAAATNNNSDDNDNDNGSDRLQALQNPSRNVLLRKGNSHHRASHHLRHPPRHLLLPPILLDLIPVPPARAQVVHLVTSASHQLHSLISTKGFSR